MRLMSSFDSVKSALSAAAPVMAGYVAIGLPCGIMESQIGLNALMAFVVSVTFYSGAGQFMIDGMWLAGSPVASIVASVSFVNTRQLLYSAGFAPYFAKTKKWLTFLFSATVTDESFGVNLSKFQQGEWSAAQATFVNLFCMFTWGVANAAGALIGDVVDIPTAIASFAMTSIFICLLVSQRFDRTAVVVVITTMLGVFACKCAGLAGPAILLGAVIGMVCGLLFDRASRRVVHRGAPDAGGEAR